MIRRLLPAIMLLMMCTMATPLPAVAFDAFPKSACVKDTKNESTPCTTSSANPIAGPNGILIRITRIIAYFGGAVAVIMIIVGAIRFITSGTDLSTGSRTDTDVEEAKNTIAYALLGLIVIVLAQFIITYVIARL